MTFAVCIKCGARKLGALTGCSGCRFTPSSSDEQARSIILSDHHMDAESLEQSSQLIKQGGSPELPTELLESYKIEMQKPSNLKSKFALVGCALLLASPWIIYLAVSLFR